MSITIYITHTDPWSSKLRTWLRRRRIKFEEWDVAEPQNKQARDDLLNKSNQLAVPMTDFNGEIVIGFDEKKLEKLVAASKGK
tara:strand:+ start:23245 stop:23493 length:249 start_codon:yes stop_codon:yes gene_type:complete